MAFDPRSGQDLKSDINVTPLVDVMLVLLIIFMLVTPMLQKGRGVELPRARNVLAVPEEKSQVLQVTLAENGQMFLDDDPVDSQSLDGALRARLAANAALQLQVKADRAVRYGDVKRILRAGRTAGFRGAAMIAEEIREPGASAPAR